MNETNQTIAPPLCLSRGGFRATFFHLGVIRFMRDAGLLPLVGGKLFRIRRKHLAGRFGHAL